MRIMNNDNEPPSLMLFSRKTDEKLVFNKCWPDVKNTILPDIDAMATVPQLASLFDLTIKACVQQVNSGSTIVDG